MFATDISLKYGTHQPETILETMPIEEASEIIKEKSLQAKPEQLKAIVEEAAQSYEHPEEVVRWYYAQPQRLAEIEGLALEDNVVEWALSCAKVVDKPVAFDDLMGRNAAQQ